MVCTSILRIGGPGLSHELSILTRELSNHFEAKNKSHDIFLIENKYFSARVRLSSLRTDHMNCDPSWREDTESIEDGIMLVFPSATHIDSLTEWHNRITSMVDCGDNIRLCISTVLGSGCSDDVTSKQDEEIYSQRVLWCLDRGYEYIEVDLTNEGLQNGFEKREKDGFARVVEAMFGTLWSSATMLKTHTSTNHLDTSIDTQQKDTSSKHLGASEDTLRGSTAKNDILPERANASVLRCKLSTDPQMQAKNQDISDNCKSESKSCDRNETMLNSFDNALKEAKIIRNASRSGDLSDDDRRQRAGNAAEVLIGLFGQIGFDNECEESSSDEEEIC